MFSGVETADLVELVQNLIRAESCDPPGDETAAATLVHDQLTRADFEHIALHHLGGRKHG